MTEIDQRTLLAQDFVRTVVQLNRVAWHKDPPFNGLKRSEFLFMAALAIICEPGTNGVKASDLSKYLQVTRAAVTHALNTLENEGLVERISDANDRRIVLVRLTDAGKQAINQANTFLLESLEELIGFLGEQDSKELLRLLTLAIEYFKGKEIYSQQYH